MAFHFEGSPVTRPGPLTRRDAERLQATLDRLNKPTIAAAPMMMQEGATGRFVTVGEQPLQAFAARITNSGYTVGEPRKYEFAEQEISYAATPACSDKDGGVTGAIADDTWARELNDATVADDTIVVMFRGADGRHWFLMPEFYTGPVVTAVECVGGVLVVESVNLVNGVEV